MNSSFEYTTALQYRLKAAKEEIEAFKSGEKYTRMEAYHQKTVRCLEQGMEKLKKELSDSRSAIAAVRRHWLEVCEDLQKENEQLRRQYEKKLQTMEARIRKTEQQRDKALDKVKEQRLENYALATELEEEKGKNLKLRAQLNRDYENSSLPSSHSTIHKKIANNREKTGRKPGGQPGHKGHGRKKQMSTMEPVFLPPPREVLEDPDFQKTKKTLSRQLVNVRVILEVQEYRADVYYNSKTGERVHAQFPDGVVNDVNYGGSVKAFLFF